MSYQASFQQIADSARDNEGQHNADKDKAIHQTRQERLKKFCGRVGAVSAQRHELAMRHINDAHQAENNGQPECHQHQHRENRESREGLHYKRVK